MSFLAFPKERNGFNQETVECIRSSPMDSSVTYVKDKKQMWNSQELFHVRHRIASSGP